MFQSVNLNENINIDDSNQSKEVKSDSNEAHNSSQDHKTNKSREITVNMLLRDFILCVTLALTTYGALHNIPPKVSRPPYPTRFFPTNSLVIDWYKGQLNKALDEINLHDFSFVMYYAPWDAECRHIQQYINTAAHLLHDKVHFVAINCWEPTGECRKQHKVPNWPILMAYTSSKKGILYQGPHDAHSFVRFLDLIMKPLMRIASSADLVNLLATCDAVVVGFTPLHETNRWYNLFYSVALKMKSYDHEGVLCFGAVTSTSLAQSLLVNSLPSVRMMTFNTTKDFQWNVTTTTEQVLTRWILDNIEVPSLRIVPTWQKSTNFDGHVSDTKPMLLLFTPLDSLYPQQPAYDLLREVSMEYHYCKENVWTMELMKLQRVQRSLYQQTNLIDYCESVQNDYLYPQKSVFSHYREKLWRNISNSKEKSESFFKKLLDIESSLGKNAPSMHLGQCENCFFSSDGSYGQCHKTTESLKFEFERNLDYDDEELILMNKFDADLDYLSPKNLFKFHINHMCSLIKFAQSRHKQVYLKKYDNYTAVLGLGCDKNASLNFIAIDSIKNQHFAESLGIDLKLKKDLTTVVILDNRAETQYILEKDYNEHSIREFVANYTANVLERHLKSAIKSDYTHVHRSNSSDVEELSAATFESFVTKPGTVRIVTICDTLCPTQVTISVRLAARALKQAYGPESRNRTILGRLDLRKHDLPWQYTPPKVPAIMVISRKALYKPCPQPSIDGLTYEYVDLGFALAVYLSGRPSMHLLQAAAMQKSKSLVLRDMKETIMSLIQTSLKQWRSFVDFRQRKILLRRLQLLRLIWLQLEVATAADIFENSRMHLSLVNMFDSLDRNWRLGIHSFIDNFDHLINNL